MTADLQPIRDRVSDALKPLAPEDRLAPLLDLLEDAPPEICWPVLLEWFPLGDNIWPHQGRLRRRLRRAGDEYLYQSQSEKMLLDNLDVEQQVFRGCNTRHRKGLSWSLSYERAEAFARRNSAISGHGNVYETMIPKRHVFAAITSRNETFLLVDKLCLPNIQLISDKPTVGTDTFLASAFTRDRVDGLRPPRTDFDQLMAGTSDKGLPPLASMPDTQLQDMLEQYRAELHWEWITGQNRMANTT